MRRVGEPSFPPPPLFLHDWGRFAWTGEDSSAEDGIAEATDNQVLRPEVPRHQQVHQPVLIEFDSRRLHQPSLACIRERASVGKPTFGSVSSEGSPKYASSRRSQAKVVHRSGKAAKVDCPHFIRSLMVGPASRSTIISCSSCTWSAVPMGRCTQGLPATRMPGSLSTTRVRARSTRDRVSLSHWCTPKSASRSVLL